MHSALGLALFSLWANALGARLAIPEIRNLGALQPNPKPELDKRITCIEDDYLLSFQMYIEDSYPSCSAYLGIPETTTFTTETAKTTVVVLQTTYQTFQQQVTVPVGTTTVTTTVPNTLAGPTFRKRQEGITPAAAVFSQCAEATGLNASLIHSVSSACSCLFITEKVNVVVTTSTQTRTEPGIDYRQTTEISTVTGPETTVYYTVKPTTYGPNPNNTISSTGSIPSPTFSTGADNGGSLTSSSSLQSSGASIPPTTAVSTPPSASSSSPIRSINGTSAAQTSSTPSSGFSVVVSTPLGTGSSSSSTGQSGQPSISGGSRGASDSSTGSATLISGVPPASSIQPPPSSVPNANSSAPIGASTGISTSASPSISGNASTTSSAFIGSPTIPTGPRGGSTIAPSSLVSSVVIPSGNSTLPSSPTSTSATPVSSDCPAENGTIYTTQCQNFLIECYINYGGPVNQGLVERSLYGCVDDCAVANVGFSQTRCYAASYYPNVIGPNCFFKTEQASLTPLDDEMTVSALLLNSNSQNSSGSGCSAPISSSNTTTNIVKSTVMTSTSVPSATGGSISISSKAATTNGTSIPRPSFTSAPGSGGPVPTNSTSIPHSSFSSAAASGSASVTANLTSITSLSRSSAPTSGSIVSSLSNSNKTSAGLTGIAPLSSGTVPRASSTKPFSTGSVPTIPAGNSTSIMPTGATSKSTPSFSISLPSGSRIDNLSMNSTVATHPATSSAPLSCTSYVYSTIYITASVPANDTGI